MIQPILLLEIHPKEVRSAHEKAKQNPVLPEAQSTIMKTLKQPRCLSKKEWTKKFCTSTIQNTIQPLIRMNSTIYNKMVPTGEQYVQ